MTIVRNIRGGSKNGHIEEAALNPGPGMSEEALDQCIEDSFPASDPPSHTPTTSLGAPKGSIEDATEAGGHRKRTLALAGGAAIAIAGAITLVASLFWRRRTHQGHRFSRH